VFRNLALAVILGAGLAYTGWKAFEMPIVYISVETGECLCVDSPAYSCADVDKKLKRYSSLMAEKVPFICEG